MQHSIKWRPKSRSHLRHRKKNYDNNNSDDVDDDKRKAPYKYHPINRRYKQNRYYRNNIKRKDLDSLASDISNKISAINNDPCLDFDKSNDTIAAGIVNKKELIISGNIKKRRIAQEDKSFFPIRDRNTGKKYKVCYDDYGINHENIKNEIIETIKNNKKYKRSDLKIKLIEDKISPKSSNEPCKLNAKNHAEMKILKYVKDSNKKKQRNRLDSIGISKSACNGCSEQLYEHNSKIDKNWKNSNEIDTNIVNEQPKTQLKTRALWEDDFQKEKINKPKKVSNWEDPNKIDIEVINKQPKVQLKTRALWEDNLRKEEISTTTFKNNFKNSYRPGGQVGLISTMLWGEDLASKSDQNMFEFNGDADALNAYTIQSKGLLNVGNRSTAIANVFEAKGGNEIIGGRVAVLEASAHAEYGLSNSVGAHISLARAEGNIGPVSAGVGLNLDCSAHAGVNGVGASVLGFGFNLGPSLTVKTPIFDFSLNLF